MSNLTENLRETKQFVEKFISTMDLAESVVEALNVNGNMKLNPDEKHVQKIYDALEKNDGFCPCRAEKNEDTVCPCKKMREENKCCCKLYVMR